MNKILKKIIAVCAITALVVSQMPVSAWADNVVGNSGSAWEQGSAVDTNSNEAHTWVVADDGQNIYFSFPAATSSISDSTPVMTLTSSAVLDVGRQGLQGDFRMYDMSGNAGQYAIWLDGDPNAGGLSVITGGAGLYAEGSSTAASREGSGNQVVVDTTSARLRSSNSSNSITVNDTANTISGTTGITGTTNINTSAAGATSIGTFNGSTTAIGNTGGTTTLTGSTNTITGTTNVNTGGTASTSIGNTTGTTSLTGSTNTINGTTNINTAGTASTSIGNTTGTTTMTGATNSIQAATTNIGTATASSANTIGNAGTSTNTMTGATNTLTGVTTITSTGTANQAIVDATSSRLVSAGGTAITAGATAASALTTDGSGLTVNNAGVVSLTNATGSGAGLNIAADGGVALTNNTASGAGLNINAAGDTVTLLNDVGAAGHGLSIGATSTTLSGGTNSSVWTLQDGSATLDVDTDQVFQATNNGTVTGVNVGSSVANSTVTINTANAAGMTTTIGSTNVGAGAVTTQAGLSSIATATTGNTIIGNAGNTVTATTGNNQITATAGTNTMSANAAGQSNTIEATGTNGVNYLTANATSGTNQIEALTTNVGVTTANSVNSIGNDTTSTNKIAGATNTIQSGVNHVLTLDSSTTEIVGTAEIYAAGTAGAGSGNNMIVDTTSSRFVSANTYSSAAVSDGSVVLLADSDGTINDRSELTMSTTSATLLVNTDAGVSHGLDINQTRSILTGGTNSSSLTLEDAAATLAVGTATTPEIQVIQATNAAGVTGVNIGSNVATSAVTINTADVSNMTTTIGSANASAGNVTMQAGTSNVLTMSTSKTEVVGATEVYAAGTAGSGSGNRMVVDTGSSRFISADGNTSAVINDTAATITGSAGHQMITDAASARIISADSNTHAVINNTAATITGSAGHQMITDATSTRFVSADTFSSVATSNQSVVLTANDDGTVNNRAQLTMAPTSATLFVNTASGVSHGVDINQTRTVISGGTNSTTMTLDDNGATFQNASTGGPAKVTGIADGTSDYDAVNYRQLKKYRDEARAGIASVAALAAIPPPVPGKKVSIGGGYGNFRGSNAGAVGAKAILFDNVMLTGGVGIDDMSEVTTSVGFGWSF
jgi:hypothetical protein